MTYGHAEPIQVKPAEYWCPTCRCPVASARVRRVHTGPPGETVHNHRGRIHDGTERQIDHTVVLAQNRMAIR